MIVSPVPDLGRAIDRQSASGAHTSARVGEGAGEGGAMDDAYDSIDEYDEQCFKGAADRAALQQMSDLDREMLLAERYERRQLRKARATQR